MRFVGTIEVTEGVNKHKYENNISISDTLYQEMELRFPKEDVNRCELLLLIPSCLVSGQWRYKREELVTRINAAVKLYKDDLGTLDSFPTELELWINYRLVSVYLFR